MGLDHREASWTAAPPRRFVFCRLRYALGLEVFICAAIPSGDAFGLDPARGGEATRDEKLRVRTGQTGQAKGEAASE
jgi:hypothetical protein